MTSTDRFQYLTLGFSINSFKDWWWWWSFVYCCWRSFFSAFSHSAWKMKQVPPKLTSRKHNSTFNQKWLDVDSWSIVPSTVPKNFACQCSVVQGFSGLVVLYLTCTVSVLVGIQKVSRYLEAGVDFASFWKMGRAQVVIGMVPYLRRNQLLSGTSFLSCFHFYIISLVHTLVLIGVDLGKQLP